MECDKFWATIENHKLGYKSCRGKICCRLDQREGQWNSKAQEEIANSFNQTYSLPWINSPSRRKYKVHKEMLMYKDKVIELKEKVVGLEKEKGLIVGFQSLIFKEK